MIYTLYQLFRIPSIFLWHRLTRKSLASTLTALGPSFIKLGQVVSARPDIIGEDRAADLALLRDQVPPFGFLKVQQIIEKELRKPLTELFQTIDETPVAAASVAQVHTAVTPDGRKVAVKVLRPGIEQAFARDLRLFRFLARLFGKHRRMQRLKLHQIVDTLEHTMRLETDLRLEAAAASELAENLAKDQGTHVPRVDWQRTARHVFTSEWVDGTAITDHASLNAKGFDLPKLAATLAETFFNQAYRDGFFHADLHPGNLFVNEQGQLVFVDFGIMGRIDRETRVAMAEIVLGFLRRDYMRVAEVHFRAGYVPSQQSVALFAQACRSIGEPIVGRPVKEMSIARLMMQLFKITEDFQMETQPQLLLLQKTMMLVEGAMSQLDPHVNFWQLAEPWMEAWARENLSPRARVKDGLREVVRHARMLVKRWEENL